MIRYQLGWRLDLLSQKSSPSTIWPLAINKGISCKKMVIEQGLLFIFIFSISTHQNAL